MQRHISDFRNLGTGNWNFPKIIILIIGNQSRITLVKFLSGLQKSLNFLLIHSQNRLLIFLFLFIFKQIAINSIKTNQRIIRLVDFNTTIFRYWSLNVNESTNKYFSTNEYWFCSPAFGSPWTKGSSSRTILTKLILVDFRFFRSPSRIYL